MAKLVHADLMTLESYAKARNAIRAGVMAHKKNRNVALGGHVTLIFEDELTIRYQVQEMLRAEKIFEEAGIRAMLTERFGHSFNYSFSYPDNIDAGNNGKFEDFISLVKDRGGNN